MSAHAIQLEDYNPALLQLPFHGRIKTAVVRLSQAPGQDFGPAPVAALFFWWVSEDGKQRLFLANKDMFFLN